MSILKKKEEKKTEQEKVEERREEVLAAGRKFKYPLQWTRYRVVANTLLIAVVIVSMLVVGGWLIVAAAYCRGTAAAPALDKSYCCTRQAAQRRSYILRDSRYFT